MRPEFGVEDRVQHWLSCGCCLTLTADSMHSSIFNCRDDPFDVLGAGITARYLRRTWSCSGRRSPAAAPAPNSVRKLPCRCPSARSTTTAGRRARQQRRASLSRRRWVAPPLLESDATAAVVSTVGSPRQQLESVIYDGSRGNVTIHQWVSLSQSVSELTRSQPV